MRVLEEYLRYDLEPLSGNQYIFTGNAYVRQDGALVMGRGAAKVVRDAYPTVQYELGEKIRSNGESYGMLLSVSAGFPIWAFQVKHHFKDAAEMSLIEESCQHLKEIAINNPEQTFHMNFPGIGNGKLREAEDEIYQLLLPLPNNVIIYKKD